MPPYTAWFSLKFLVCIVICHMAVIIIHYVLTESTTAVNELQVAIKYIFDLAVRNVRGQIASNFFKVVHMFQPRYF